MTRNLISILAVSLIGLLYAYKICFWYNEQMPDIGIPIATLIIVMLLSHKRDRKGQIFLIFSALTITFLLFYYLDIIFLGYSVLLVLSFLLIFFPHNRLNRLILLRGILIVCICFVSLTYILYPGNQIYGITPFHSHIYSNNLGVSLLPGTSLTESGVLGVIISLLALKERKYLYLLVGIYLTIFSFNRSSMLILFISILLLRVNNKKIRHILSIMTILMPIVFIIAETKLLGNSFFADLGLDKSNKDGINPRLLTAIALFELIENMPLFGMGRLNFKEILNGLPFSELRILNLVINYGVLALYWLLIMFHRLFKVNRMGDITSLCSYLAFFIYLFYYGSFLHPYHPLFLLLMTTIISLNDRSKSYHINSLG